ncbi:MAG: NDP-sugar synthase [Thermoplasmata archaeon]
MRALLLIGGFGTRLRPLTETVPKQLIPVAGKTLLEHVLDLVPEEVEEIVLATGYKADTIDAYLREHRPRIPVRSIHEETPLGTGGAIRNAAPALSDPFYLLNSDVVAQVDLRALLERYRAAGAFGVLGLAWVDDTRPYGVAALEGDRIVSFVEKPEPERSPSHWINAGYAVWSREVADAIPPGRMVSLEKEILPGLLPRGIYGHRMDGYFEDAGTPERLLHAQRLLFDSGRAAPSVPLPTGQAEGAVACDPTARIEDGARIGPYATVGARVRVGRGARIEDAVLMEGARIGADATVRRSLVGPGASVGPAERVEGRIVVAPSAG